MNILLRCFAIFILLFYGVTTWLFPDFVAGEKANIILRLLFIFVYVSVFIFMLIEYVVKHRSRITACLLGIALAILLTHYMTFLLLIIVNFIRGETIIILFLFIFLIFVNYLALRSKQVLWAKMINISIAVSGLMGLIFSLKIIWLN